MHEVDKPNEREEYLARLRVRFDELAKADEFLKAMSADERADVTHHIDGINDSAVALSRYCRSLVDDPIVEDVEQVLIDVDVEIDHMLHHYVTMISVLRAAKAWEFGDSATILKIKKSPPVTDDDV